VRRISAKPQRIRFFGKPLAPVVAAIDFRARRCGRTFWLAVGYNLLAVPVAISRVVTLLIAAALRGINSLRPSPSDQNRLTAF
jgi:hypothetical protein